jgi:K+-transporting ATPase ATPase A chain
VAPNELLQIVLFIVLLIVVTPLLGGYMANVFTGKRTFLSPVMQPAETLIYRLAGVNPNHEMHWTEYAVVLVVFNIGIFVFLFVLQLLQGVLPLNPQKLPGVNWALAFNTAASFMTNTNWQSYAGETTMSYLTQVLGLTMHNFASAAIGITVQLALTRGLIRRATKSEEHTLGNFWADLVRATLYILLPLSLIFALVLISQGVVQTFAPYANVTTLDGAQQQIPLGPAASQIAIKQLGTNGGGFFGANSAYPFENPTPLANFLEAFAILMIPASLTYTYGVMVGSRRQGWAIFAAMSILLAVGLTVALASEYSPNPIFNGLKPMEGKEVRNGVANSILWQVITTATSSGSVNSMHDSATPLAGGVSLVNMMLGEVVFGGVGAGMYGMLHFVILTVFIAGLMVGRTPEYLGKKIESREIQMAILAILFPSVGILILSAIALVTPAGLSGLNNNGPHGLSEILYAFTSGAANNGSAFAGLNTNTDFYNILIGIEILIGRFGVIIPALVIAGSMVKKKITPPTSGTFPTDRFMFVGLLVAITIIVGALTFFPALTLGPVVEHFLMTAGHTF